MRSDRGACCCSSWLRQRPSPTPTTRRSRRLVSRPPSDASGRRRRPWRGRPPPGRRMSRCSLRSPSTFSARGTTPPQKTSIERVLALEPASEEARRWLADARLDRGAPDQAWVGLYGAATTYSGQTSASPLFTGVLTLDAQLADRWVVGALYRVLGSTSGDRGGRAGRRRRGAHPAGGAPLVRPGVAGLAAGAPRCGHLPGGGHHGGCRAGVRLRRGRGRPLGDGPLRAGVARLGGGQLVRRC